jgi:hypothetical protein
MGSKRALACSLWRPHRSDYLMRINAISDEGVENHTRGRTLPACCSRHPAGNSSCGEISAARENFLDPSAGCGREHAGSVRPPQMERERTLLACCSRHPAGNSSCREISAAREIFLDPSAGCGREHAGCVLPPADSAVEVWQPIEIELIRLDPAVSPELLRLLVDVDLRRADPTRFSFFRSCRWG